jgi:hypothetical protein
MSQLVLTYSFLILFNACFFSMMMALPYVAKNIQMADLVSLAF